MRRVILKDSDTVDVDNTSPLSCFVICTADDTYLVHITEHNEWNAVSVINREPYTLNSFLSHREIIKDALKRGYKVMEHSSFYEFCISFITP